MKMNPTAALFTIFGASVGATLPAAHADAFSSIPYRGNPACVVLLQAEFPEAQWMQHVANEMQLSETAFLVPREEENEFDLRWFTPTDEVDLCGHATLASSHVLWDVHKRDQSKPLTFHTRSGALIATRDSSGWIELDFPTMPAVPVPRESSDWDGVLLAFPNLEAADVLYIGRNRVGGPGGGDLLLEVTPSAFAALQFDLSAIEKYVVCRVLSITTAGCPVTPPPGRAESDYDFTSRSFAPSVGAPEDPVCGSAHCMLGPYWQARLGGKSQLFARAASPRGGDVRVRVNGERTLLGGQAVTTLKGELMHV